MRGTKLVWAALSVIVLCAECGFAQQRVFTNDDVSPAPASDAAPPPVAPASAPSNAASDQAASKPGDKPNPELANLNRLKAMRQLFLSLFDQVAAMTDDTKDADTQQTMSKMRDSFGNVIRASQVAIEEMQGQLGIKAEPAQGAEGSQPAPCRSPEAQ